MIRFLTYFLFSIVFTTNSTKNLAPSLKINNLENEEITTSDTSFLKELEEKYLTTHQQFQAEKVYVQLDKTQYQPGETIWFNAFVRNANTNLPTEASEIVHVELYAPNGSVIKNFQLNIKDGMARGDILLNVDVVGGWYTLKVYTIWQSNLVAQEVEKKFGFEKEILIQKSVLPNLRMKLDFKKETYSANDIVSAELTLKTLENSELRYHDFEYTVNLDGEKWLIESGKTDFDGKGILTFQLPKHLTSNDGLLNVMINYNGLTESISRAIPIVLNDIDLQFMPEGGYIIPQETNNVAFKALDEFGEPADVEGMVLNENNEQVASFSTYHQGMGVFQIKPLSLTNYKVKITKPAGITKVYPLKMSKQEVKVGLQVSEQQKGFIKVKIFNHSNENLGLVAHTKGKIYNTQYIKSNASEVKISTKNMPSGILTLTLLDHENKPYSERLVFVNHHKRLNISIQTDKKQYQPREKVKMKISAKDHLGNAVSGQLALSVVDDKLLSFADDKQANILGYMLLQSELKGQVKEANFYFENPEEHQDKNQLYALDLLMMTQGWRKFEWINRSLTPNTAKLNEAEKRYISGKVLPLYGNSGLKGVTVKISALNLKTKTNENGFFKFDNVWIGEEPLIVEIKDRRDVTNFLECQNYGEYSVRYKRQEDIESYTNYSRNYASNRSRFRNRTPSTVTVQTSKNQVANSKAKAVGKILDATGESLIGASVTIQGTENGAITGAITDIEGNFELDNLNPGKYIFVFSYVGYNTIQEEVTLAAGDLVRFDVSMEEGMDVSEILVVGYSSQKEGAVNTIEVGNDNFDAIPNTGQGVELNAEPTNNPSIRPDQTTKGKTITAEDIKNLPSRSITGIVATTAGVSSADDGGILNFRGSRSSATIVYVDGVRVNGKVIPQTETERVEIFNSGTSAAFNDGAYIGPSLSRPPSLGALEPNQSIVSRFNSFQKTLSASKYDSPLYFLDGKLVSYKIAEKVFNQIDPKVITQLRFLERKSSKKRYSDAGQNGAYIIKTNYRKHPEILHYEVKFENEIDNQLDFYNTQLNIFNDKNDELENVFNGIEIPSYATINSIKEVGGSHNMLSDLEQSIKEMAKFVNKKVNIKGELPSLSKAKKYLYALNFKEGLYQSREFYTPKYIAKKDKRQDRRNDFRSTIYWNPNVQLNEKGNATVEFYTSDAITTFRATIEGIGVNGEIGREENTFFSQMPFGMLTKVPTVVLTGDEMKIPLTLMNNTQKSITGKIIAIMPEGFELVETLPVNITLSAEERRTILLAYKVNKLVTDAKINIRFEAQNTWDEFEESITILERGFPFREVLIGKKDSLMPIVIQEAMDSSIQSKLTLYPSKLGEVVEAAKRMIRQPYGCFEQTSSSNYPNILVYDYLQKVNQLDASTKNRLTMYLNRGYKRLTSFEVNGGGFDWYGKPAAHEGLTAMGLMQFKDMAKVYPVSQEMINRTAEWLLSRRDGKGSWKYKDNGYHSWKANGEVADAYMVWAISRAGYGTRISKELEKSYNDAIQTKDPYVMALVADALFLKKDNRATSLFKELLSLQNEEGFWNGKTLSITRSTKSTLRKETTALAIIAWISGIENGQLSVNEQLTKALKYISKSKSYHGFGSTQATVLIMKALIDYETLAPSAFSADNRYAIFVNQQKIIEAAYPSSSNHPIVIEGLGKYLQNGNNEVSVLFKDKKAALPYDLELTYRTKFPKSQDQSPIKVTTTLSKNTVKIGSTVRLSTTIKNTKNENSANTIAIVGIPSGLSLQPWQLKELNDKEAFDYYELMDGFIVFHYRGLYANAEKVIHLDLKADISGIYEASASSAYLYYSDEVKDWARGVSVKVE